MGLLIYDEALSRVETKEIIADKTDQLPPEGLGMDHQGDADYEAHHAPLEAVAFSLSACLCSLASGASTFD